MRTIKRIRERRRQELLRFLLYPQRINPGTEPSSPAELEASTSGIWALPDNPAPSAWDWRTGRSSWHGGLNGLRGL